VQVALVVQAPQAPQAVQAVQEAPKRAVA